MRHNFAGLAALINGGAVGYWILYDQCFRSDCHEYWETGMLGYMIVAGVNGDLLIPAIVAGVSFVLAYASLSFMGLSVVFGSLALLIVWSLDHAPSSERKVMRQLFVSNQCSKAMELTVSYFPEPKSESQIQAGWWQIDSGQKRYIADYFGKTVEVSGEKIYYFARSLPYGERVVSGLDKYVEFRGEELLLKELFRGVDEKRIFHLNLSCSNDDEA